MSTARTVAPVEPLKLVPFNPVWIAHDKLDLHGIYQRPRFVDDEFGERQREYDKNGLATWDLTGPLPIKAHNKWTSKGYKYVTLSDRDSLQTAGRAGTIEGDWRQYDQHQTGGPWNYKKFLAGQQQTVAREADQLRADVERFGSEAVEHIRRQSEPEFVLPEHMRGVAPGGKVTPTTTPPAADAAPEAKSPTPGKKQGAAA